VTEFFVIYPGKRSCQNSVLKPIISILYPMKNALKLILLAFPFYLGAQDIKKADALVSPRVAERQITVGGEDAQVSGFNNQSIQFAIDALEETGGKVLLNPGIYEIVAPVRIRSNVQLLGSGKETVLKRSEGVQTPYIIDADYGELKLTVENADGFEIGMKVQVTDDDNRGCWNVSTAYITDVSDNVIYIDKGLIRDYRSDKNGLISNASSVIEVLDAENVLISNLVADGNREENFFADGCNSAGVLILRSREVTVDGVQVKDFNGEGISWQITENVRVRNCEVSGSGNTGLHPGTGSPFSVIENNNVHHNDLDGLFICWRVYEAGWQEMNSITMEGTEYVQGTRIRTFYLKTIVFIITRAMESTFAENGRAMLLTETPSSGIPLKTTEPTEELMAFPLTPRPGICYLKKMYLRTRQTLKKQPFIYMRPDRNLNWIITSLMPTNLGNWCLRRNDLDLTLIKQILLCLCCKDSHSSFYLFVFQD